MQKNLPQYFFLDFAKDNVFIQEMIVKGDKRFLAVDIKYPPGPYIILEYYCKEKNVVKGGLSPLYNDNLLLGIHIISFLDKPIINLVHPHFSARSNCIKGERASK